MDEVEKKKHKKQKHKREEDGDGSDPQAAAAPEPAAGLASMFSSTSMNKFARAVKPEEIVVKTKRQPVLDPEDQEKERLKQEKRKVKRAKRYDALDKAEQAALQRSKPDESDATRREVIAAKPAAATASAPASASASDSASAGAAPGVDRRSVFFGNVPLSATVALGVAKMRAYCSKFGAVESLRVRSLPIEGTAVDEAGNQTLVRRVCAQQSKLGAQKSAMNVYVVFQDEASVALALAENNTVMGEGKDARHIRVDRAAPSAFPPALTVFLGGVPLYADEEELRAHFAAVLPNGQEDIRGVRLVRDAETMVGKGIGYLLLSDRDAVMAALSLHGQKYKKRWDLRVTPCAKRTKSSLAGADGMLIKRKARDRDAASGDAAAEGAGEGEGEGEGKKARKEKDVIRPGAERRIFKAGAKGDRDHKPYKSAGKSVTKPGSGFGSSSSSSGGGGAGKPAFSFKLNAGVGKDKGKGKGKDGDARSKPVINLKNTKTRKMVLKDKGQLKKEKGRKGKRLGGNVKKAMKAAKGK